MNEQIKNLQQKKNKIQSSNVKDKTYKINKINNKIKLLKLKKETKIKMKNVSLGTSKTNYIDPRIVFSFMNKFNIPEEKLFTKTLLDRFKWATNVDAKWRF
jgi:DNA topoisomerase-1